MATADYQDVRADEREKAEHEDPGERLDRELAELHQELRVALRAWHRRHPDYSLKPGHQLAYTTGIRSVDHFPMVLGR